jgi:hypothetical protein
MMRFFSHLLTAARGTPLEVDVKRLTSRVVFVSIRRIEADLYA